MTLEAKEGVPAQDYTVCIDILFKIGNNLKFLYSL